MTRCLCRAFVPSAGSLPGRQPASRPKPMQPTARPALTPARHSPVEILASRVIPGQQGHPGNGAVRHCVTRDVAPRAVIRSFRHKGLRDLFLTGRGRAAALEKARPGPAGRTGCGNRVTPAEPAWLPAASAQGRAGRTLGDRRQWSVADYLMRTESTSSSTIEQGEYPVREPSRALPHPSRRAAAGDHRRRPEAISSRDGASARREPDDAASRSPRRAGGDP